jgi:DNA replication protein DnaC
MAAAPPPPLTTDLEQALKRLKLRRIRQIAPEVLATAKTQRWAPEEVLHTLIEAEIAARDASNLANRLRAASFPMVKTLDEFQLTASSIPKATFNYLASLEWIDAAENIVLVGPPGTGKSHVLIALGYAAVHTERRVRYLTAAELVERLFAGLADNSVGKTIDSLLRHHYLIIDELGFAPLDPVGSQLLFRFIAAAYERRALGLASHHPFENWGRFLPEQTTATALLDRLLHHAIVVTTSGESFRMREAKTRTTTRRKETT